MAEQWTEESLVKAATHLQCEMCQETEPIENFSEKPTDLDDIERNFYGEWEDVHGECCGDPLLIPLIVSDKPLFGVESVDNDHKISANARLGITNDGWRYEVSDELVAYLQDAGIYA